MNQLILHEEEEFILILLLAYNLLKVALDFGMVMITICVFTHGIHWRSCDVLNLALCWDLSRHNLTYYSQQLYEVEITSILYCLDKDTEVQGHDTLCPQTCRW